MLTSAIAGLFLGVMNITRKIHTYAGANGPVEVPFEVAVVTVTLGGKAREIEVTRTAGGHTNPLLGWDYAGPVLAQVGRGTKVHTRRHARLYPDAAGNLKFGHCVICNRNARVFAWADEDNTGNSGWTNNTVS